MKRSHFNRRAKKKEDSNQCLPFFSHKKRDVNEWNFKSLKKSFLLEFFKRYRTNPISRAFVSDQKIATILSAVKVPMEHPLFLSRIFAFVARIRKARQTEDDRLRALIEEEYEELSRRLDRSAIQESCSVRNILRTRQLAMFLIDDKGELNAHLLAKVIALLKENLYSLGPNRHHDAKRQEHILNVLHLLDTNKDLVRALKKIGRPYLNKHAEEFIRETLQLPSTVVIQDAHTRRAVLSAWLCYLRQNIGSCFATAPAEVVHDEQPALFLQDITDLLATGRLKRTFSGVEYSVPLSASWGIGDLKKPLIIKHLSSGIQPELWYSPGLMAAFEVVGLLKKDERIKNKIQQLKEWIIPLLNQSDPYLPYSITSAEEIIRTLLLQSLHLTEQQVKDYQNRPRSMIQSQLIVHSTHSSKEGGVGERCANFIYQFEVAKNAFKSLADNALLKAWEFTLASFSETKLEFTRWNLYSSLGMGTQEPGGIGQCIYQVVQKKLDVVNRQVEELNNEYEVLYTQVKMAESRMRHASTEKEVQWLKIEYQSRVSELYSLQEMRDERQSQARELVNLYESLYQLYLELFKDYFQEVYDADMQGVITGPFDDSPAGFRLVYKHGRSNTSQWTRIQNQYEFIDALASFFVATEPQILAELDSKSLERDLSEIVTAIINHIKTKEFLETAFHRMAAAHQAPLIANPLDHLEQIEKKPWVYTSGGTMNTLVSCYYCIEGKPKEVERWVENETELLVFFADTLKQMSPGLLEPYLSGKRKSMLMQSPTHAFLLKPTHSPFKETWTNEEFTYTAIRDRFIKPVEVFISQMLLDEPMLHFLIEQFLGKVPENYKPRFKSLFAHVSGPLNPTFFRDYLVETLIQDRGLRYGTRPVLSSDEIDGFLYSELPLFYSYELKDRIHQILILLPGIDSQQVDDILDLYDKVSLSPGRIIMTANQLQDICKALLCLYQLKTTTSVDYPFYISQAAQKLGFAMPAPLIFADSNWVKDLFAFVVNPGTGRLDFWCVDYIGRQGFPLVSWKPWLNGSRPDLKWGIYVYPPQYGQV